MIVWALNTHDAGKLPGKSGHATFEPVSFMTGDGFGEGIDESGTIAAEDRHDEVAAHGTNQSMAVAQCELEMAWELAAAVISFFVERIAEVRKFHNPLAKSAVLGAYFCGNS